MTRPTKYARHPVEALLRQCISNGETPSRADVDALNLPASERRRFDNAVSEALAIRSAGDRGVANETALHAARDIVHDLPERLQHPGYNYRDPLANIDDPAELAAAIPRGMSDLQIPTND